MAVQHTITTNDIVDTLAYDSPVFRPKPGYCAVMLRWKMYIESGKQRNQPGKYISLMGGRGQAGARYQDHYGKEKTGPEGWSYYMTAGASRSDPRGVVGSANRPDLGGKCKGGPMLGGDPINGDQQRCYEAAQRFKPAESMPTGRWVQVELTSVMNDKNRANGSAIFIFNGKKISWSDVMWAMDPEVSPELYVRWRMMYGGTPADLPAPNNIKEWYKDFELLVAY